MGILLTALILSQAQAGAPSASEVMKKVESSPELKDKDKPFEIAVSLGKLYLGQGRYSDAALYFSQALSAAAEARRLAKQLGTASATTPIPAQCEPTADKTLAQLVERTKAAQAAGPSKRDEAIGCARAAVSALPEVDVLAGHSLFLNGSFDDALKTYSQSLDTFPNNLEARYARAALVLDSKGDDVKFLQSAKVDFELVTAAKPPSARQRQAETLLKRTVEALAAGGLSKVAPAPSTAQAAATPTPTAPPLSPQMMEAFQNTPRTPEMEAKFEKLVVDAETHLAKGRFQEALDNYKQVMPFQPDNARLRAGMACSLFGLQKPMAERVWTVASQSPEAIDALGDRLKSLGDSAGAKAVWTRLKATVPAYAPKVEAKITAP
jgi:tetratricopeptide (TPR) repeat protein